MRNRMIAGLAVFAAAALLTPAQASAQEEVPTTVTVGNGRTVKVGAQQYGANKTGRIPPGWTRRADRANAQFLEVDDQVVGMALSAGPEGKLSRVHVAAAEGSDITVVIGFYDQIASADAINVQETYECKKCGRVLVCSVAPTCGE
jgi:hypothetical protein